MGACPYRGSAAPQRVMPDKEKVVGAVLGRSRPLTQAGPVGYTISMTNHCLDFSEKTKLPLPSLLLRVTAPGRG